jgi:hypothetical protein
MSYISYFKQRYENVKQIGSKQMCIVTDNKGNRLLYSYYTVIGYCHFGVWQMTDKRYSTTTSKQQSQFKRDNFYNIVPHDQFMQNLNHIGVTIGGWN